MKQTHEYTIVEIPWHNQTKAEVKLNEAAMFGWRVVSVIKPEAGNVQVYMERPIPKRRWWKK